MSKRRQFAFSVVLAILAAILVSAFIALALRLRDRQIAGSDHLDPGMFRHHRQLGWELVPDWEGRHRHYDYDVSYAINRLGFRADTGAAGSRPSPMMAVLGDSFTFGFGVEDDETFVHRLDDWVRPSGCVVNFAVPGTSTDQHLLLLERRLLNFRPQAVLLVVYLGNDLVDNQRPFPTQASNAKPFFELGSEGLVLRNVPVPTDAQAVVDPQGTLRRAILGAAASEQAGSRARLLMERLGRGVEMDHAAVIEAQLGPSMALFQALADRAADACDPGDADFLLALMAGRSYLEYPESLSSQYQEIVRRRIVDWAGERELPVIDLAQAMRDQAQGLPTGWYFPNEGHLTPAGHRVVAEILSPYVKE